MGIVKNNEVNDLQWRKLPDTSPYASPFQTSEFYKLYNAIPILTADVFAIEEASELKALCIVTLQREPGIKSYFSRRTIIYGGPVLRDDDQVILEYQLTYIINELYEYRESCIKTY